MEKGMILVAEVKVLDTMNSLFGPLGSALAPLSFYVTPCVQDANYINRIRHKGEMTWIQFAELVSKRLSNNIHMEINKDNKLIKIFTDEKTYLSSVYSNNEYIDKIYKQNKLPIIFE